MLDNAQLLAIRSRFPILRNKIYLNSCSQGALSDAVEDGIREYVASWHEHGSPWDTWVERYEAARAQFAAFIGATPDEVAVIASASAGINSIASALDFAHRPKVVLGEFEFPTMGHIWLAQQQRGARIEFIDAVGDGIPVSGYEQAIDHRTLIVPLTGICFRNGFRSPVLDVVRLSHASGALVFLDDYQDCGTRAVNVRDSNVDFYVAGTLKYLLGPPGLAFMYVRKELIESLRPASTGWFAQQNPFAFDAKHLDLARSARRFEGGSPPVPNVYAAMRGISLLQEIGLAEVSQHIARLAQALLAGARDQGWHAKTPADSVGPLCVLRCKDAATLVQKLAQDGIVCSSRHDGLRLSFHVYNTLSDVNYVLDALRRNVDLLIASGAAVYG